MDSREEPAALVPVVEVDSDTADHEHRRRGLSGLAGAGSQSANDACAASLAPWVQPSRTRWPVPNRPAGTNEMAGYA